MYKTIFNPNQKIRFNWYGKKLGVSGFETYTIAVFFCCSMAYPNVSCLHKYNNYTLKVPTT